MTDLPLDSQITFLYARDLAESARFYEEALGLPLALDQGSCRVYRVASATAYLGICQRAEAPAGGWLIYTLVTPDVDGWYQRIISRGWACEHPPRRNETYDIYHFFVRDPAGNLIEIQRFAQDDWDGA